MSENFLKPQPPMIQSVCARLLSATLLAGTALIGVADRTASGGLPPAATTHWTADNGNGTYSNPLFHEEFEDPNTIRVGEDYYLAGTTMHVNPAVQIMHSRDLVNWELVGYCMDRLDLSGRSSPKGGPRKAGIIVAHALQRPFKIAAFTPNVLGFPFWQVANPPLQPKANHECLARISSKVCIDLVPNFEKFSS
jgi:hypothetical protein